MDSGEPVVRVAFATCTTLPYLTHDDRLLVGALADIGVPVEPLVWDDPEVDWGAYDVVVVRSVWDYVPRREEFLAWAAQVPRLANPADVLRWNTDKRYLRDLDRVGIPVVPTEWFEPGTPVHALPSAGSYVVKPAVSAGADHTHRHDLGTPYGQQAVRAHIAAICASGNTAMLQPYLASVDTIGETALMYAAGTFTHAARKSSILRAADGGAVHTDLDDPISAQDARPGQLEVGAAALAAVPGGPDRLLYARIDMIDDDDGCPRILELELTEPSLFLRAYAGAAAVFAAAIDDWAREKPVDTYSA